MQKKKERFFPPHQRHFRKKAHTQELFSCFSLWHFVRENVCCKNTPYVVESNIPDLVSSSQFYLLCEIKGGRRDQHSQKNTQAPPPQKITILEKLSSAWEVVSKPGQFSERGWRWGVSRRWGRGEGVLLKAELSRGTSPKLSCDHFGGGGFHTNCNPPKKTQARPSAKPWDVIGVRHRLRAHEGEDLQCRPQRGDSGMHMCLPGVPRNYFSVETGGGGFICD